MDFNFTEEQNLLRDSIAKWVASRYDFDKRRALAKAAGFSRTHWAEIAESGLLAASLPEEYGGFGGGPIDTMIIMEEFGKGLVLEPFVPCVTLCGGLLAQAGSAAQKAEHVTKIAAGERIFAFAHAEPKSRYHMSHVETHARKDGAGYVLNGHKAVVLGAPMADHLLVSARTGGQIAEENGISLFIVAKDAQGIRTRDYPTVDGLRASEIYLENVALGADALVGAEGMALASLEAGVDHAIAALCAEAVGAMKMMHDITLDYARTRKQFGVPIASFQVLQHRMVDMFMAYEQSVSMTYMVALKVGDPSPVERAKAASAAKVQIGKAGRFIGQSAVQIHGGIGMTEEYRVGHYFKRATMIDSQFGNVDYHLRRFAALSNRAAA